MNSSDPGKVDRIIDEVLGDLAAGEPREGFRSRVMARIAAAPEPAPLRFIEVFGWRVRPFQLAAAGALAAAGLVAALVIPALVRPGGPAPVDATTAARPAVPAPQAAVERPGQAGGASPVQAASLGTQPQPGQSAARRAAQTSAAQAADEDAGAIWWLRAEPLPGPDPIVNTAVEIRPVEIEQLVIPEIEVRPLDAGGKVRDIGEHR
jgi:hypothetical protein